MGNSFECVQCHDSTIMLRVVIISTLPPIQAGESPYTENLIQELEQYEDIEIHAVSFNEADDLECESDRVHTHSIWNPRSPFYPCILSQKIRELKPHIVHVQFGPHGEVFGGLFGEPMLLLLLLLRLAGIRTTVTLHSTWMPDQVEERIRSYGIMGRLSLFARPMFRLYNRFLDLGTTTIQLSTTTLESSLRSHFLKEYNINPEKVLEIPHPCKPVAQVPDTRVAQAQLGLENKKITLSFGFIRRGKGIETAIEAMDNVRSEVDDALLLIAGRPLDSDGARYLKELKNLRRRLGLEEWVQFRSKYIEDELVPHYFAAASVIVLPYGESVGASGPAHNYAGYGIPIVASDAGLHMRDTLGGSLTLFERGNATELAQKLVSLLGNPERRERIGEEMKEYASEETWSVAARRTLQNYVKTLRIK